MAKFTKEELSRLHPETLALSHGFDPWLSEGAVKPPAFLTSTFAFRKASDGKQFFAWLHGHGTPPSKDKMGLVYSRINNPNLEIFEDRLAIWEGMDRAVSFSSGMAAMTTTLLGILQPGDEIVALHPLYGGTEGFITDFLKRFGVSTRSVAAGVNAPAMAEKEITAKTRLILLETPANPTLMLTDIEAVKKVAQKCGQKFGTRILVMVDNTVAGPVFSQPAKFGADIVLYSATKYIGGHSDLVAGAVLVNDPELLGKILVHRATFGGMPNPYTAWLLTRSLETLKVRMEAMQLNAMKVAEYLCKHPKVKKVYFLGLLRKGDPEYMIYKKQYTGTGSLMSFDIKGGEKECFRFLDNLKLFKLAVSLGSTESLAEHPDTMTHSDVTPELKKMSGITESLVRISVGVENAQDLIWDIEQALAKV